MFAHDYTLDESVNAAFRVSEHAEWMCEQAELGKVPVEVAARAVAKARRMLAACLPYAVPKRS